MVHNGFPSAEKCTLHQLWSVCRWVEGTVKSSISMALQIYYWSVLFCSVNGFDIFCCGLQTFMVHSTIIIVWGCTYGGVEGTCMHQSYLFSSFSTAVPDLQF
jgi:hypothetical protein